MLAVAKLKQFDGVDVLEIVLEALHDALDILADAQVLDHNVILVQIRKRVDLERVAVQGLEHVLEVRFRKVTQVHLSFVIGVRLLKELRLDRKEGDLQLVLAGRRLDCDVEVGVVGEVQQQLRVGQSGQSDFHVCGYCQYSNSLFLFF